MAVREQLKNKSVRLVASKIHFESAFFDTELTGEKPYAAVSSLNAQPDKRDRVAQLLRGLVDHAAPLPEGSVEWTDLAQLEAVVAVA